jgi:hypothetical protein
LIQLARRFAGNVCAAILFLCIAGATAEAGELEANELVLLHAYAERVPEEGLHYVNYLLRTLGDRAPRHGDPLRSAVETRVSRNPGTGIDVAKLRQQVDAGCQHFIEGEYEQSIQELSVARTKMLTQQAMMAVDQTLRDVLHRTTLFLAHAQLRAGNASEAATLVAETIRSFPDRSLSPVHHGPDLVRLFRQERRRLRQQERGSLAIEAKPAGCMVFVNERYVGLSPTRLTDLYPGTYRVFLQRPNEPGRVHIVEVASAPRELKVDFLLDRALQTAPEVLLLYPNQATKAELVQRHAGRIGRNVGARQVLLVTLRRYQGRLSLQGTVLDATNDGTVRAALIALEPNTPAPKTIKALGRFLVFGERSDQITLVERTLPTRRASGSIWRWITLGVGLASLGGGIPLLVIHDKGTCGQTSCAETYNTLAPGLGLTIAGGALLAGSAVLFVIDALADGPAESPSRSARVVPWLDGQGAGVSADIRF